MTPSTIINAVCQVFPVQPEDITGPRRRRNEADARRVVAALCYDHLRMSNGQISRLLNRCTASVHDERDRHVELLEVDPQYRRMVQQVIGILNINAVAA